MRIARVVTSLALDGRSRQVLASDLELVRRGHSIRILAGEPEPGEGDLRPLFLRLGLKVAAVPGLKRRVAPLGDVLAGLALRLPRALSKGCETQRAIPLERSNKTLTWSCYR